MNARSCWSFAVSALALFVSTQHALAQDKPNILIIWGDDIGVWNISAMNRGMMGYKTPNIDRIASEGIMFTDYYGQQSCTAGRAAFMLGQAPFRSGVSIMDFQLDPLVRAIDMARANLLIADDVGLGKTIEAGLVIQELLLRHRARTIFVVCPASLKHQWCEEIARVCEQMASRRVEADLVNR